MDAQVLIRFIEFLQSVFGRINSKRIIVLCVYLLFLLYSRSMTDLAVYLGSIMTLITLWMVWIKPKNDLLEEK